MIFKEIIYMIMVLVINQGGNTIRKTIINVPDENDFAFVEALQNLGVNRNVAVLIMYLKESNECTSKEIETATGLRQPEVSIAMQTLRERGWVAERELKKEGKGRPMKVYALRPTIVDIIKFYEDGKLQESEQIVQVFTKLRELISA
jgi:predicted transcriptional regulator